MINCWFISLSKNKGLEFQISRWEDSKWFNVDFQYRNNQMDHKGFDIDLTLFRIEFRAAFYDKRHREEYNDN